MSKLKVTLPGNISPDFYEHRAEAEVSYSFEVSSEGVLTILGHVGQSVPAPVAAYPHDNWMKVTTVD